LELSKLLTSIEELSKKSKTMQQAESPANKLKAKLLEKQKTLQEITAIAKEISVLNSAASQRKKSESDKTAHRPPKSKRSSQHSCKNLVALSAASGANPGQCSDMRKLALKNSMRNRLRATTASNGSGTSKSHNNKVKNTPSKSAFRTTEASFGEAYSKYVDRAGAKIDFLGTRSNPGVVREVNQLVGCK
jgi:hypothetical protein